MDKILLTRDISTEFKVSIPTVTNWCNAGLFPNAKKVNYPRGEVWEIPEQDLINFARPSRGRKQVPEPTDLAIAKRRQRARELV